MQTNAVNCTYFFQGTMLLATTKIFKWCLEEDSQARVQIEQQSLVARDFLKQYRRGLKRQRILRNELDMFEVQASSDSELSTPVARRDLQEQQEFSSFDADTHAMQGHKHRSGTVLPAQSYIEAIFREENLASRVNDGNLVPNSNVLPSEQTTLVGCFYCAAHIYTLDTDSLVRQWCLKRGNCLRSYPLEIHASALN